MAYVAMSSAAVTGLSRLHGDMSRQIFRSIFHCWPSAEVGEQSVLNDLTG